MCVCGEARRVCAGEVGREGARERVGGRRCVCWSVLPAATRVCGDSVLPAGEGVGKKVGQWWQAGGVCGERGVTVV